MHFEGERGELRTRCWVTFLDECRLDRWYFVRRRGGMEGLS